MEYIVDFTNIVNFIRWAKNKLETNRPLRICRFSDGEPYICVYGLTYSEYRNEQRMEQATQRLAELKQTKKTISKVNISKIAKDYKIKVRDFNKYLDEIGFWQD